VCGRSAIANAEGKNDPIRAACIRTVTLHNCRPETRRNGRPARCRGYALEGSLFRLIIITRPWAVHYHFVTKLASSARWNRTASLRPALKRCAPQHRLCRSGLAELVLSKWFCRSGSAKAAKLVEAAAERMAFDTHLAYNSPAAIPAALQLFSKPPA